MVRALYLVGLGVFLSMGISYGESNISLKAYYEFYESLKISTGNPSPSENIRTLYQSVRELLPKFGKVEEMNCSAQLSAIRIAAEFCNALVAKDSAEAEPLKRWAHKVVDFNEIPLKLSPEMKESVLKEHAALFWQRDISEEEKTLMLLYLNEFSKSLPANVSGTRQLFMVACTLFANSIDFFAVL